MSHIGQFSRIMTEKAEAVNLHLRDDAVFFEEDGAGGAQGGPHGAESHQYVRLFGRLVGRCPQNIAGICQNDH